MDTSSTSRSPVIAVIPNYNMAQGLRCLLPQVLEQDYDRVFVLDDASTDDSVHAAHQFGDRVQVVAGDQNIGRGANRNRILPFLVTLDHETIIHFIDADMQLQTQNIPALARRVFAEHKAGFVCGLVQDVSGQQIAFNYGPRMCLRSDLAAQIQTLVLVLNRTRPALAKRIQRMFSAFLADWPNIFAPPRPRQIFWGVEQNLFIPAKLFADFGGFDPSLQEHEIQDLSMRMAAHNLPRWFDPRIVLIDTNINIRSTNRNLSMAQNELRIIKKFGLRTWLLPGGKFHPDL